MINIFHARARVRCMTFGARDQALVLGTSIAVVYVLAADSLAIAHVIHSPHRDEVVGVAMSHDGQLLATGCKDKHARVFDLSIESCEESDKPPSNMIYSLERDRVYALDFSPIGHFLLVGADDKLIQIIEPKLGITVYTIDVFTDYVRAARFFHNGRSFMAACKNGLICAFDFDSGEQVRLTSCSLNVSPLISLLELSILDPFSRLAGPLKKRWSQESKGTEGSAILGVGKRGAKKADDGSKAGEAK